mgnify:CR=1 FL=1
MVCRSGLLKVAISRGFQSLSPQIVTRDKQDSLTGYVSALSISQINVPVEFQHGLSHDVRTNKTSPFQARVAYGQRLEPWIVELTKVGGK